MQHNDMQPSEEEAPERQELFDENAFGLWVSWFDAEEVEYAQSASKFPPRIIVFRSALAEYLERHEPGQGAVALDLGTSLYLEVGDGEHTPDLIGWLRGLRAYLAEGDWRTFAVLAHGGRWVATDRGVCMPSTAGSVRVMASFGPSEPFRKAMAAESLSHDDEDTGHEGWGPGLFVDVEALEALGRKLKNEPTPMYAGGTCFFRIGA